MKTGQTLAHYTIVDKIGAGGMGEVYRATDTRLGRDVALKILPPHFADDPERLARFEREARTLASFQHANIASIYGIEQDAGHRFLVMELAEGEDLSVRLARGPLEVDQAIDVCRQIAEGLEAAHEAGIIHRDLKPANVVMTPDGLVKILDFGLARAFDGDAETHLPENSPTLTAAFTAPGVILGTAAYMSPEQARGKSVDKRSDIWAFGVILWESLTGERLFAGETISDILAAVLTRDTDPSRLPDDLPVAVRSLLTRCLMRDPKARLRDIGEARLLLADPQASVTMLGGMDLPAEPAPPVGIGKRIMQVVPWVLTAIFAFFGYQGLMGIGNRGSEDLHVRRFEVSAALPQVYNTRAVEISPDGTRIAIFALDGLWVRDLDDPQPRLLVEPDDLSFNEVGATPFWSPDGIHIGYAAHGRIWKVPADGGNPQAIGILPGDWMGGTWTADGTIVFSTSRGPMYSVPARGGDPTVFLATEDGVELDYHQPSFVPDGGGVIYSVHRAEGVDTLELLRNGERTVLLRIEGKVRENVQVVNNPVYSSSGHIIYQRDQGTRGVWALPFDAAQGEVTGPPFMVASEMGHPSISRNGLLIHTSLQSSVASQVISVSRSGELLEVLTESLPGATHPSISPDGTRIVYSARERQNNDLYILDRTTGITNQLTHTEESDLWPVWIPGTDRIIFTSPFEDCNALWILNADGSGQPQFVVAKASNPSVGPDGIELAYVTQCSKERGLMRLRIGESTEPVLLREHPAGIESPRFSPDGRFLAYLTWETGEVSLEVADYPDMKSRHLLARTESDLQWSSDSREIYFMSRETLTMMAVELEDGPNFGIRAERPLFEVEPLGVNHYSDFSVSADGQEFIMVRNPQGIRGLRTFTVVENWYEEFRE